MMYPTWIPHLFQLLGVAAVAVGIWLRADPTFHQFVDVNNEFNFIFSAGYVIISVGVVVAAAGVLGLCAAVTYNICILVTVGGFHMECVNCYQRCSTWYLYLYLWRKYLYNSVM